MVNSIFDHIEVYADFKRYGAKSSKRIVAAPITKVGARGAWVVGEFINIELEG